MRLEADAKLKLEIYTAKYLRIINLMISFLYLNNHSSLKLNYVLFFQRDAEFTSASL